VLVVDDESTIADTLVLILKLKNCDAFSAYSAEEAVQLAETIDPQVLISDVVMGPMSGVDLAIYFVTRFTDCRVLLISGHSSAGQIMSLADLKGFAFPILAKPVPPQEIIGFIESST
jgi:DNA-binding NtrC family response regulator